MDKTQRADQTRFWGLYLLLLVPVLNWLIGAVLAFQTACHLLERRQFLRLLVLAAGSTVWCGLSLYLAPFGYGEPAWGLVMLVASLVWTRYMLAWMCLWRGEAAEALVELSGRIES